MSEFEFEKSPPADIETNALKVPPHSVEAEQSVLGGLMLSNGSFDDVSELVSEVDFYRRDHRLIYRAMVQLVAEDKPFDVVTLGEVLDNSDLLAEASGMAYLAELAKNTPSAANIKAYADIVRERSILRQMIQVSSEIAESAFSTEGRSSAEILDEAERKVFAIAEQGAKQGGPVGIKDILKSTVDKIDLLFSSGDAITGVTTGFKDLDDITSGMQASDLIIVAAIAATNLNTIVGPVNWATGPINNVTKTPLVAGQWQKNSTGMELEIVANSSAPEIALTSELKLIG